MSTKKFSMILLLAAMGFMYSFSTSNVGDPWVVPAKYKSMANPLKGDKASIAEGKALYIKHCKSCHGKEGLGDGPKAAQLKTKCGDFTADLGPQTDGALFYKLTEGRDDMPSFKKKIPADEDRWSIVNYLRTLK